MSARCRATVNAGPLHAAMSRRTSSSVSTSAGKRRPAVVRRGGLTRIRADRADFDTDLCMGGSGAADRSAIERNVTVSLPEPGPDSKESGSGSPMAQ